MSPSRPAPSLLENASVEAYLDDLGAPIRAAAGPSFDRTNNRDFHRGLIDLDDGLLEHDTPETTQFHQPAEQASRAATRNEWPRAALPAVAADQGDPGDHAAADADAPDAAPFGTALFMLAMSLVGASTAAFVFHARLLRIFGW
jgi:hypothetical protein